MLSHESLTKLRCFMKWMAKSSWLLELCMKPGYPQPPSAYCQRLLLTPRKTQQALVASAEITSFFMFIFLCPQTSQKR